MPHKIPAYSALKPPKNRNAKPYREGLENPCASCSACCEYVAVEIDVPTSLDDFDTIHWYLVHNDVWVYVDHDHDWHIQFNAKCGKLQDQRCSYYASRPQVCRDYHPETCTYYNEEPPEKVILKNEEDLWEYLKYQRPTMYTKMAERFGLKD